jgi:DNA/RNA-binding protein KIN17
LYDRWASLTEFVKYLGRTGQCKVEDTPKGWFITYIVQDSETMFKDRLKAKRIKADLVDEERQERAIQVQIERAQSSIPSSQTEGSSTQNQQEDPKPDNNNLSGGKVAFLLQPTSSDSKAVKGGVKLLLEEETANESSRKRKGEDLKRKGTGLSALDLLMQEEEKKKEKSNRKDYWLCEGIIVKVMIHAFLLL